MTRAMQKRLAKNRASTLDSVRVIGAYILAMPKDERPKPKPVHRPIQAHRNLSPKGGFIATRVS